MIGRLKRVAASDLLRSRTAFSESIRRHVESYSDSLQRTFTLLIIHCCLKVMKEITLNTVEGMKIPNNFKF